MTSYRMQNLVMWACLLCVAGSGYGQDISPQQIAAEAAQAYEGNKLRQSTYAGSAHGEIDWENGMIIVSAYGAADKSRVQNEADEKVQAIDAAYYNAVSQLGEIVLGVQIDGVVTVGSSIESGLIQQTWKGKLRQVRHLSEYDKWERLADGSLLAQATVSMPLYGEQGFIPMIVQQEPFWKEVTKVTPTPVKPAPLPEPKRIEYSGWTGLVLDCRSLHGGFRQAVLISVMTPDGKSVYGKEYVPREILMNNGMVWYGTSLSGKLAQDKVGPKPLVITVTGSKLDQFNQPCLVVTHEDANRIIWADQQTPFRSKGRVLLLF